MNVVVVTQARTGSTRLPNKIFKEVNNESLLQIHINRIRQASKISEIIVATTTNKSDDIIESFAKNNDISFFRGSEDDVLDRFYQAVKNRKPDYIVRLTSDCPLIDGNLIDEIVNKALKERVDYCSNTLVESFPDGQDIEVFTFKALETAWKEALLLSEREHVTPYIKNNSNFYDKDKFKAINVLSGNDDYEKVRMTVDEDNDFRVISKLIQSLGVVANWEDYAKEYLTNEDIHNLNMDITRNEGYLKSVKKDKDE